MPSWFSGQPLGRKLLITTASVAALAALAALSILALRDVVRFQRTARADAASVGRLLVEGARGPLESYTPQEAQRQLQALQYRPNVILGCVYGENGALYSAGYHREAEQQCPATVPPDPGWLVLAAHVPLDRHAESRGAAASSGLLYIERDWAPLVARLEDIGLASVVVLALSIGLSVLLARRLQRSIFTPVADLAAAARTIGLGERYDMPRVASEQDEIGSLVTAFGAMVERVRTTNADLRETNEALRHEIAERKRAEADREMLLVRERDANRLKDEFLAVVSHELRTPLNAILGWSRILSLAPPDPATLGRATASLSRNARAQARVIDDLIDISRIVTGKLRVRFETVDLRASIEAAVESIRPSAEHKNVALTIDLPRDPAPLQADRDRVQQIVWNLLSNAVKFSSIGGSVTVTLTSTPVEYAVAIKDTGAGIAPEFLPHVFDRFRQADASMTREHGGLGIGLAIVKELTELHGGSVTALSEGRGQGSTFIVRFSRTLKQTLDDPSSDSGPLPSLAGIRVLAVDDNDDALEVLEAVLTEAGASVRVAHTGAAAVAAWENEPPDVLLCDLAMPDMSGYQVLAEIRRRETASGSFVPAIAVTAQATHEHISRSLRAGFAHHIAKPFEATEVVRVVAHTVRRS